MRRVTPFALLALLLFLPCQAEPPADFDKGRVKAMLAAAEDHARRAEAQFGAVDEKPVLLKPGAAEVSVDCDAGQSVNQVLTRRLSRYLTVNLSGTCRESILVERPGITLSGTLAGGAVIDPPEGPAIKALWAHELRLADLTLTGATDGLLALASRGMVLERVRAVDNEMWGVYLESSTAEIRDSELSRNAEPIFLFKHSTADVHDSVMEDNAPWGPWTLRQSTMMIYDSTMRRNTWGLFVGNHSHMTVEDSTLGEPGTAALAGVRFTGSLILRRSEVHTVVFAFENSYLGINRSTIGTDAAKTELWVGYGSYLDVWGGPTIINADIWLVASGEAEVWIPEPIHGDVYIAEFGEGAFYTGAPIEGGVYCWDRGRAFCSPHPTDGVHDCE